MTLASTGSSEERRYSFVRGTSTGSADAAKDPDEAASDLPLDLRERFGFQFLESARLARSLSGAKLVVNGTEHDIENRGISSGRRYRGVRTSDEVRYSYSSGRALTVNLKFAGCAGDEVSSRQSGFFQLGESGASLLPVAFRSMLIGNQIVAEGSLKAEEHMSRAGRGKFGNFTGGGTADG